VLKFSK